MYTRKGDDCVDPYREERCEEICALIILISIAILFYVCILHGLCTWPKDTIELNELPYIWDIVNP